nr:hypothetical protein [Tanacetum cinerariifolium]
MEKELKRRDGRMISVAKSDKKKQPAKKPKAKGLAVLSEVALTKAEQLTLATKRSKKDFHISHASGSGDGFDTQSKVPDDQQQKTSSTDERTEEADINDDDSDDNDESDDERTESDSDVIPDPNKTYKEHDDDEEEYDDEFNLEEDENIDEEEDDEVTKEFFKDVNVNLGNKDADMTYADQGATKQQHASHQLGFEPEEEDAHVTLTHVLDTQKTGGPTQSSFVSSDFTSKLLNLDNPSSADNEIASLMDTTAYHATTIPKIISSFDTPTPPPLSFFNHLQQEATPTLHQQFLKLQPHLPLFWILNRGTKTRKLSKDAESSRDSRSKEKKSSSTSKDAFQTRHKSSGKSAHAEEPSQYVEDSGKQQDQEFINGDNDEQLVDNEVTKADWFEKPD